MPFAELLDRLLELALERHGEEQALPLLAAGS